MTLALSIFGFAGSVGGFYDGVGITFPGCSWSNGESLSCLGCLTNLFGMVDVKGPFFFAL